MKCSYSQVTNTDPQLTHCVKRNKYLPIIQEVSVHREQYTEVTLAADDPDGILGALEVDTNLKMRQKETIFQQHDHLFIDPLSPKCNQILVSLYKKNNTLLHAKVTRMKEVISE